MNEYVSLSISIVALALSIASAIYTWLEHRKAARVRARDEIVEALSAIDRYTTAFWAMKRERDKTGAPKEPFEKEAFDQLNALSDNFNSLKELLRALLVKKPHALDEKTMRELRGIKQSAESFSAMADMFFNRFKRFNENRLPELRAQVEALHHALSSSGLG